MIHGNFYSSIYLFIFLFKNDFKKNVSSADHEKIILQVRLVPILSSLEGDVVPGQET